jgi:hypothetical protein
VVELPPFSAYPRGESSNSAGLATAYHSDA